MVQPDICRLTAATMERRKKERVVDTGLQLVKGIRWGRGSY